MLDQCDQVLVHDPKNVKVHFRMAQALFALSKDRASTSMVKSAFTHVKTAIDLSPNDTSIKTFFDEVKVRYDEVELAEKAKQEEEGPKEETKKSTEAKLLSRVKIEEETLPPLG